MIVSLLFLICSWEREGRRIGEGKEREELAHSSRALFFRKKERGEGSFFSHPFGSAETGGEKEGEIQLSSLSGKGVLWEGEREKEEGGRG